MNEKLTFYCKTCSCLICRDCSVVLHKDHNIAELSTVADAHRDEMRDTLQSAEDFVSKLADAIEANKKSILQVEFSKQRSKLDIEHIFKQLVETLEVRKKALLLELDTTAQLKATSINHQTEQFENIQQDIGRCTKMVSHILQTHTDHELVALEGLMTTELKATLKKVENVSLTPNQHRHMAFVIQADPIIKQLSQAGSFSDLSPAPQDSKFTVISVPRVNTNCLVEAQTMSSNDVTYPCGGLQVKAELRPKSHDGPVISGEVEDHGDGTYTISLTPQTAGPHQLHITMDGQHVQKSPFDILVRGDYTTLYNPQQVINVSSRPYCVFINDNGDIYVGSEDDHIYVFDQGGNLKNTIGSRGGESGQFRGAAGLCVKEGVIYVADYHNHRIQKLTTGGTFIHQFGEKGSDQGQFNGPWDIIVDAKDRMIVSDSENNRVQVFNQDGVWLFTIDGNREDDFLYKAPRGLALDSNGNIHIAAYGSNIIMVFSAEGTFVKMQGDVKCPIGIAIDEEGFIFVGERGGNCLSIFDPQGQKIHTVGNLNNPFGVALDTKGGSVYVSNCGSSNVLRYSL